MRAIIMTKQLGYKRVSSIDQNEDRQLDGIKLDKIYIDKMTGSVRERPQLDALIDYARDGDVIHVHSIDRLARDLRHLQEIVELLISNGVTIKFHSESLTFNGEDNAMNTLLLHVMGAFAQFERALIRSRQKEGIAIAKSKGKHCGRPPLDYTRRDEAIGYSKQDMNISQIAKAMSLSRASIYKLLE
jgi:DNA invertase Pin-like site-specific DNA recombinase